MALTVAQLRAVLGLDTRPFDKGLQDTKQSVRKHAGFMQQAGATMTGFLGAQVVQQGARGVAAGFAFAKDAVFGFNDEMDRATTAFTTMLGSGKRARSFLDDLKQFATQTPFEFPELVSNSQKLLAMGFAAKDVLPTLTAVGDATAGLGGDPGTMAQIIRALGQMQAKGKVTAGEMTQLAEAGVGAWDMLAKSMGVSVPKAMEAVEKGQVRAASAVPAIVGGMNKQFGGLMEAQTRTWSGALSNIKDTAVQVLAGALRPQFDMAREKAVEFAAWLGEGHVQAGLKKIGNALKGETATGVLDDLKATARSLWDTARPIAEELWPLMVDGARELGDLLTGTLIPAVRSVAGWMSEHKSVVYSLLVAMTALMAITKLHAAVMAVQAAGGILAMLKGMKLVTAATKAWAAVQWLLNIALSANPIGLVVLGIAALVAGLVIAWKKSETFRNVVTGAFGAVKDAASAAWNWVKDKWPLLLAIVTGPIGLAARFVIRRWGAIKGGVADAWGWVKKNWPLLLAIITGPIGLAARFVIRRWDSIKDGAARAWGWVRENWGRVLGFITGPIGAAARFVVGKWEAIRGGAVAVVEWIRGIPGRLRNLGSAFANAGTHLIGKFFEGLRKVGGVVLDVAGDIWGHVRGFLNTGVDRVNSAIPDKLGPINLPDNPFPHFARGGFMPRSGWAVVGETGWELARLPGGTQVFPHRQSVQMLRDAAAGDPRVVQHVHASPTMNERQLADVSVGRLVAALSILGG